MLKRGLTQVYTTARGFYNFAPFGLALRAAGQNLRIAVFTLTPHPLIEESRVFAQWLHPHVTLDCKAALASNDGHHPGGSGSVLEETAASLERAREAMLAGRYDMVILNGVHDVLADRLVEKDKVLALIAQRPVNVELVLSGADADFEIVDCADLVTEMHALKHTGAGQEPRAASPADQTNAGDEVEVVTGRGKGKTTYCLGKAALLSARGIPALVLQFIKSAQPYGEVTAIRRLPHMEIITMGEGFPPGEASEDEGRHREAAREAWRFLLSTLRTPGYGVVVLDEIHIAVDYDFVARSQVTEMLKSRPSNMHFFLSGRYAPLEVMEAGTIVLEMKEIKHPFRRGIRARRGIEF